MASRIRVAFPAVLLTLFASSLQAQPHTPTYARDVAPILYKNCTTCHRPGGIGPMSLLTYDDAKGSASEMREVVRDGVMPPWHADAPRGMFVNDRRLSDADKQTIASWIDGGTPAGESKDMPDAPTYPSSWVGKPDQVFSMPAEYEVPAKGTIEYQYFEVPTNFTEDKWITSIEILPGAREVVHHALVFARAPRPPAPATPPPPRTGPPPTPLILHREDQAIPDPPESQPPLGALIATTAPGTNLQTFPAGTALRVRAGSVLVFQMHYTAHGHAMKDRTSVGFTFAPAPPDEPIFAASFQNGQFTLPAGAADVKVPAEVAFSDTVRIWGLFPHTHLRGKKWEYRLVEPDGSSRVILSVPNYDFNWQTYYMFSTPLEMRPGQRIESYAWYDNSPGNKNNPDATKDVHWGDQTWEEMQYTGFLFTVNSRRLNKSRP